MRREDTTPISNAQFESVHQPMSPRDWLTGDELEWLILRDWDDNSEHTNESVETPKDSLLAEGWTAEHRDAANASVGEIWTTRGSDAIPHPKLVVIYRRHDVGEETWSIPLIDVFPVSFQHQYAAQFDLLVAREDSPLSVGFMVETPLRVSILVSSLDACVGRLSPDQREQLLFLSAMRFGWSRGDANRPAREMFFDIPQGDPIVERDDIRLQFREHERKNVSYLVEPANAVLAEMNRVEDAQRASSLTVQARQPWTHVVREWGEKKLSAARAYGEKVFEEVVGAGVDWMTAVENVPWVQPQYGGSEDEEARARSEARERFRDGEGTSVYPPENVADVVEGCFFRVLCIETGYYLQILVRNAEIPLEVGVLEIDDEPIFEAGLFPGTPNLAGGRVYRLPIENETVAHEVILPFARNGKEDIVRFRIEPMSLVLSAKRVETNAGDE